MFNKKYLQAILAIAVGLFFGGIIIAFTGENVFETYAIMLRGGFGSPFYLSATLARATPIIIAGIAFSLAWKSGYSTIGMEGQMVLGAFVSAVVAVSFPGPPFVKTMAAIVAALLTGTAYSLLSGWLYKKFQVILIISTLMMNYIAGFLTSYFTNFVVKDPTALDSSAIQTQKIAQKVVFPKMTGDFSIDLGFGIAVLVVAAAWFLMKKSRFGYQAKMGGLNPKFAEYGGINPTRMLYSTLAISGALSALAGVSVVMGQTGRYIDGMISSPGYAWTGLVAVLIADFEPLGVLISSIFLAGLAVGGSAVERSTSIPVEVTSLIQGIITLFISARIVLNILKKRMPKKTEGVDA